jgi:carboxyl-terminal processing protease
VRHINSAFLTLGIVLRAACPFVAAGTDEPRPESLALRVRAICDAVLTHHVEAPTRQQMIHAGIVAMYRAVGRPLPSGLGERISGLTTPEQFDALLADVRPAPGGDAQTEAAIDAAFLDGLASGVPGGLRLMEGRESKVAEQLAGNRYVGIQISVMMDDEAKLPKIISPFEGGPAHRAGMKADDVIEAVDGVDIGGGTLAEYIERLRGAEGTEVTVRARRAGETAPLTFRMTREAMRHPTISGPAGGKGYRLPAADPIGYLKINSILASTPREVREAAAKMEAEGMQAVVLDLRQPTLGRGVEELHPAVLLADELMDSGTIGRVRLAAREVTYRAEPGAVFRDWPMIVLVDRGTAAHAEWLAAALKDNGRATLVGVTTAGLGASHSTVPLGDGSRTMNLATGLLERADGRPIGYLSPANLDSSRFQVPRFLAEPETRHGVAPDVFIPIVRTPAARTAEPEDPQLTAAVERLRKALGRGGNAGGAPSPAPAGEKSQ